jgi:hypothetical protein
MKQFSLLIFAVAVIFSQLRSLPAQFYRVGAE